MDGWEAGVGAHAGEGGVTAVVVPLGSSRGMEAKNTGGELEREDREMAHPAVLMTTQAPLG